MATNAKYGMDEESGEPRVAVMDGKNMKKVSKKKKEEASRTFSLFEKSSGSVNLSFDNDVLEKFYLECTFPQTCRRLRFGMIFIAICALCWLIFFAAQQLPSWTGYVVGCVLVLLLSVAFFGVTYAPFFSKFYLWVSLGVAGLLALIVLLSFAIAIPGVSLVFNLSIVIQFILVIYSLFPLRLWHDIALGGLVSLIHVGVCALVYDLNQNRFVAVNIFIHLAVHIIGITVHLMSQVRRRSTFLKLCQSARIKKDIIFGQQRKIDMIRSLMPDKVAHEVMKGSEEEGEEQADFESECSEDEEPGKIGAQDEGGDDSDDGHSSNPPEVAQTGLVTFRKFHVNQMENVSILFADIVGFTKMSSNKTAPHLVNLLNDLFARFDKLCELTGCEKIATLGDCYYCVAGCPDSIEDHAERCVEMGRSMCCAIQQFDIDHHEEVNMRVGVHTGMVICGIVGTRRFKFDVWSNDVTLANEMESSGEPGLVHISESTHGFVTDLYEVRLGTPVPDIRKIKVLIEYFDEVQKCYAIKHTQEDALIQTYFIEKRYDEKPVYKLPPINTTDVIDEADNDADDTQNPVEAAAEAQKTLAQPDAVDRRESSDTDLVKGMRADSNPENIFYWPPISAVTLNFRDARLETKYRSLGLSPPRKTKTSLTWATPRVTPVVNGFASFLFLLVLIIACFVGFPYGSEYSSANGALFYVFVVLAIFFYLVYLLPLIIDLVFWFNAPAGFQKIYKSFFSWCPRNFFGAVLLIMPSAVVLSNFRSCSFTDDTFGYNTMICMMFVCMVCNFTLFTMYSSWTKSIVATVTVIICLVLLHCRTFFSQNCEDPTTFQKYYSDRNNTEAIWISGTTVIEWETTATLLLTLVLLWFLNREFDISYRLSFNCDHTAFVEKRLISKEKRQTDWLIVNIIPYYIYDELKLTSKYSRHLEDTAVVFASISNFGEFYDEQFEGGKEMLRVLNEIFSDFEHLLALSKYKSVEKIKTIGACFMAASGLNEALNKVEKNQKKWPFVHLCALMDFCNDLLRTIEEFNLQIFNFDFELKIGYNVGDVTAGVIGSTKLLYDIWGDTVNVASRMYSTGMKGRIQVTESVAQLLENRYEFEYRGVCFVKGKGDMKTYLLVKKKPEK